MPRRERACGILALWPSLRDLAGRADVPETPLRHPSLYRYRKKHGDDPLSLVA